MIVTSRSVLSFRSLIQDNAPSHRITMASPNGDGGPNHYDGPINPRNYALHGAVGDTYLKPNQTEKHSSQYTECPFTPCKYRSPNTSPCDVLINCGSASDHLRVVHNVRDMSRSDSITCAWTGCGLLSLRNNIIRHVREVHLGHCRNPDR